MCGIEIPIWIIAGGVAGLYILGFVGFVAADTVRYRKPGMVLQASWGEILKDSARWPFLWIIRKG